jgi:alginate O-acetyltransferase complex protein AlgI
MNIEPAATNSEGRKTWNSANAGSNGEPSVARNRANVGYPRLGEFIAEQAAFIDYLFTPLSMSLRDLGRAGLILCLMLNMVIIGLWHGLTLNFLVFGLLQGIFVSVTALVIMSLRRRGRTSVEPAPRGQTDAMGERARRWTLALAGTILTFVLMSFSTIFFHSRTWDQAVSILKQVLAVSPSGPLGWSDMPAYLSVPAWICGAVALFVGAGAPGAKALAARIDRVAPQWLQYGLCLFLLSVLSTAGSGRFVYGQF